MKTFIPWSIAVISLGALIFELLPYGDFDNYTREILCDGGIRCQSDMLALTKLGWEPVVVVKRWDGKLVYRFEARRMAQR